MDAVEVSASGEPPPQPRDEDVVGVMPDICRVCLLGSPMLRDLFHRTEPISLADKAMSLASVKMMAEDGLPPHICYDCVDKLESAYKFKLQVEQADSVLREKLDALKDIKEELFFSDVDVNLTSHRNDVSELTKESLLLKDHMDLLNVPKISEDDLQGQSIHNQVGLDQNMSTKNETDETNQQFSHVAQQIQGTQEINGQQDVRMQEDEGIHQMSNDDHNQSFGSQDLQEMMFREYGNQDQMHDELNQTQQVAIHEHNYVAESHTCDMPNASDILNSQDIEEDGIENVINTYHDTEESSPCESMRRSKRKINPHKAHVDQDADIDHYFENLNLSSRLKKSPVDKSEKVYFMCYLCDRQFLSKEVLKEHMHSHEEIRKTLTQKSAQKSNKSPDKSPSISSSPTESKSPSSGKHPNTCPHCGKEYLYIISYNKHVKQHEQELKVENMPLEISFHEDDDTLEFHGYDDQPVAVSENESKAIKLEDQAEENTEIKKLDMHKCNVCEEEFDTMEKLRDHRSKHVVEGVLTEQDSPTHGKEIDNQVNQLVNPVVEEPIEPAPTTPRKRPSSLTPRKSSSRREQLRRGFRCSQCSRNFGSELSLRNHLMSSDHGTTVQDHENDENKRQKRVAARAAQRIIDQIKNQEQRPPEKDLEDFTSDDGTDDEEEPLAKKLQRATKHTLYCATCNQRCSSKQALARHMEQHVKDESRVKSEGGESAIKHEADEFMHDDEIEHSEEEEDDDDYEGGLDWPMESYDCPTCKKKYSTKKSLLRHQLLHEEPNFECDICGAKFYRKDKLKAHYDKCSEKNPDQVRKCNICGDSFENNDILKEHRAKHVTEGILTEEDLREIEPRPEDRNGEKAPRKRRTDIVGLECTECNKQYTSRKGLLRHIQVHEGKKYLCDICPKKFYRREHLKIHVAKHNMIKPYKCPRCTKRFIKEEQMHMHQLKHERTCKKTKETDTSKRFLCEICSKSFTQSTTLIAHLRAHNGIKPYVCEVCSRPFTTNAYLKMHMRTHTQERPYVCQYCSRAFARADTLANHLTSHTGEAKYHCKYCPKHFRRLKSLKEHVFIHTGQRPYACPTCDRRFNNNGSRYAHSKRCKQNLLQTRPTITSLQVAQEFQEPEEQLQLQVTTEQQLQRIQHATISQAQIIKPQNIKTITITRNDGGLGQQHVMAHQEILMPLILPLAVTLTDVGEEVILPEGTKIFTA